ncbi:MAG: dihydropteroate synthase, partial [Lutibacter sp.]|nr:dihydropteroate synthase [Lutibacter sp.]
YYFSKKIAELHKLGVNDIITDVGFGFGKTTEHNYQLLKHLELFKNLETPLLAGLSRKGMLYKPLNITADAALNATTAANTIALLHGASILRVHDVKEAVEAVKIVTLLNNKL